MKNWFLLILLTSLVIAGWGATLFILHDDPNRGTFGDMFGGVNALFSGLAFVGVIVAIFMQKKELELQRKELGYTREELQGQKEQLKAQNETLQHQSFESTFFQLLRLQSEIIQSIDLIGTQNRVTSGRDCFQVFHKRLSEFWQKEGKVSGDPIQDIETVNSIYLKFYQKHQSEVGHYFRSLYNIVKFVDSSDAVDKRLYTNLIRAQLSSYELALLFYNTLSDMGRQKFKPLIETYSLLKTLDDALLFAPDAHKKLFEKSAFEKNIA